MRTSKVYVSKNLKDWGSGELLGTGGGGGGGEEGQFLAIIF